MLKNIILVISLICLTFEKCHKNCEECYEFSADDNDMKCISCTEDLFFLFNTSNCVDPGFYPTYYYNYTDDSLYPCSLFNESNCYECEPFLGLDGICLSCKPGFALNYDTYECEKCNSDEYPIIFGDFENCYEGFLLYCDLFTTVCLPKENNEIKCPMITPYFNNITESCHEYEC